MIFHDDLIKTARIVGAGGVVALPTEGIWGLSCQIGNFSAIRRLLDLKKRDREKGLITLVIDFAHLDPWFTCPVIELAQHESGRPPTWIIPVNDDCPKLLTGGRNSMAARRVKMPYLLRLIRITGPLVSTSANRSGRAACTNRWQVMNQLAGLVDHVAMGQTQGYRKPSTIREMQTGTIIRD
ncbi:MAG: tRNA threonylcarbamoyladenosine biosynthesis protein RimN [Gammaproteobacteria bacterium]|nr:tRNA threonylcarbamoyladenosine biosynthesis protein RimN [Gammaproteobacteria bacterium]